MMTCRHVRQLHDGFLDGELPPSLTAEVHAHLLQCPACQQEVEMIRACADVIGKDHAAPLLEPDFADRVVASLPKMDCASPRSRFGRWHLMGISTLAAAAGLLLAVLLWPTEPVDDRQTFVAGVTATSGFDRVVNPTLDAVVDTQRAAKDLNQLLEISVGSARQNVKAGLKEAGAATDLSFTGILLKPFDEFLQSSEQQASDSKDTEIVRF